MVEERKHSTDRGEILSWEAAKGKRGMEKHTPTGVH